ncbi:hypothetical protein C8F01DRAFT_694437 [Mycena amicta]|nr:hypothetical protein C8F01DRAFT_694437 [Mycena amicta]
MDAFKTFGGYIVGSWIASVLYGAALSQAIRYFRDFPNDTLLRKGTVVTALVFGLVALIADYGNAYIPLVSHWGDPAGLQSVYWSIPTYGSFNTAIGVVVNSFLITRFWSLSKNIFVTVILSLLVALSLVSSLIGNIMLGMSAQKISSNTIRTMGTIWSISLAACDVSIAAALVWKLQGMKSSFKTTNNLIQRLILGAVQTGATTAVLALFLLTFFLVNPANSLAPLFACTIGPCYLHTLFLNFNSRRTGTTSGATRTTSDTRHNINNTIVMDGIQVHRTAIVTMDPPDEARSRHMDVESVGKTDVDADSYGSQKVRVAGFD